MGKQPAFQFYPGDWFREPGLRASSIAAKGAWAQILFSMHDAKEKGKLSGDLEYWGNLIGVSEILALYLLRELEEKGVCDVEFQDDFSRNIFYKKCNDEKICVTKEKHNNNDILNSALPKRYQKCYHDVTDRYQNVTINVTIINRRMYRQFLEDKRNRKKQQNYRDRQKVKKQKKSNEQDITDKRYRDVTAYSSSSSSITPLTPLKGESALSQKRDFKKEAQKVLDYLNEKFHRKFSDSSQIITRLKQGGTVEQCKQIIDTKSHDPHFQKNPHLFCPATLFRKSHWDTYLNQKPSDFTQDGPEPVIVPYKPPALPEEHDRVLPEEIRETLKTLRKRGLRQ